MIHQVNLHALVSDKLSFVAEFDGRLIFLLTQAFIRCLKVFDRIAIVQFPCYDLVAELDGWAETV
jgi:hypothetical protein